MKLAEGFVLHETCDAFIIVPVANKKNADRGSGDGKKFSGMIRLNRTGGMIAKLLTEDTTADAITDALFAKYDAPRNVIAQNVDMILTKLRSVGAIQD